VRVDTTAASHEWRAGGANVRCHLKQTFHECCPADAQATERPSPHPKRGFISEVDQHQPPPKAGRQSLAFAQRNMAQRDPSSCCAAACWGDPL